MLYSYTCESGDVTPVIISSYIEVQESQPKRVPVHIYSIEFIWLYWPHKLTVAASSLVPNPSSLVVEKGDLFTLTAHAWDFH